MQCKLSWKLLDGNQAIILFILSNFTLSRIPINSLSELMSVDRKNEWNIHNSTKSLLSFVMKRMINVSVIWFIPRLHHRLTL